MLDAILRLLRSDYVPSQYRLTLQWAAAEGLSITRDTAIPSVRFAFSSVLLGEYWTTLKQSTALPPCYHSLRI